MANPQPDKFTRISNEILEVLFKKKLSGQELQLILFIMRKTYGFNKKEDYISLSQIAKALNTSVVRSSQLINKLQQRKIITLKENIKGYTKKYSFNKDYEQWTTLNKNIKLNKKHKKHLIKSVSTKDIYTKDIYIVLNKWNSKSELTSHELKDQIGHNIIKQINKHKKNKEKIEDIISAIDNYYEIYINPNCYFKYKWDLDEFLQRRGGYLRFKKPLKELQDNFTDKKKEPEYEHPQANQECLK